MKLITKLNVDQHRANLEQMFHLRHKVLVIEKGWTAIRQTDGLEIDEFDNENAVYIITLDRHGNTSGCIRLYPSWLPNLTTEHFAHLCDLEDPPRSETTFDVSRLVVDTRKYGQRKSAIYASQLILGCFEACLQLEVSELSAVLNAHYVTMSIAMGWDIRPLGTPQTIGNDTVLAVKIPVSTEQLKQGRSSRKYFKSLLDDEGLELLQATKEEMMKRGKIAA